MINANKVRFSAEVFLKACIIFAPLILAIYYVREFESGKSDFLLRFNNIDGNTHLINNVLLAFIVASYLVVFIGLGLYLWSILFDLSGYIGNGRAVRLLNTLSLALLLIIAFALFFYLVVVAIACSSRVPELVSFHQLVVTNKWLSFGVFFAFLVADVLAWRSQIIQEKENTTLMSSYAQGTEPYKKFEKQLKLNGLLKQYAKDTTVVVNVPTLILNGSVVLLTSYLDLSIRLRGMVDPQLHLYEVKFGLQGEIYSLFLNGIETGVIVCSIVFSQLVYLFVKTRCDWKIQSLGLAKENKKSK